MGYVSLSSARHHFGVSGKTLYRWEASGKVTVKRSPGNRRLFLVDDPQPQYEPTRESVVYVRVSSSKQQDDMRRQEKYLLDQHPGSRVVRDIGSGLNFKRKGLLSLLERSEEGLLRRVVVASEDRLCRFGFDLLAWQFKRHGVELLVCDKADKSPEAELAEDVLAVIQVFGCRWNGKRSYNRAVSLMHETSVYNKMRLRNMITPAEVNQDNLWLLETPKDIRAGAVFEAAKNIKAAFTNKARGNIENFKMGYRSRKKEDSCGWTINVPKTALKVKGERCLQVYRDSCPWLFQTLGRIGPLSMDCKIQFDGMRYFLIVPYERHVVSPRREGVIALDPGVRTFQTAYSPDGHCYELGRSCCRRLEALCVHLDRLISLASVTPKTLRRTKWAMGLRIKKLRRRLQSLRDEMHYKAADYLTRTAHIILLPTFETKDMTRRTTRRLRSRTVRNLSLLSHYKFKQRLIAKAAVRGVKVLQVSEHYTSKTCGRCGSIHETLGGRRVFKCPRCGVVLDRDCNGARNVLLRAMREEPPSRGAMQDGATVDMPCLAWTNE
ncbi:hypothetical protein KFL_003890030 [Klebsormidium nitens]|uniref:Resolvase/invertase-type recombinase catalytic domain-containing protein n=1 Tax=Klebsormidium nitens TaxID=105231 RepID=A0A1Y1IDA6_KLENI|nr:hypothetical protein KFL_003890030 [Klebsormidium nitens]|eukprot:GAQ87932.1 hypothetical protein KFL_003890030 [Klebsormidium nitens]